MKLIIAFVQGDDAGPVLAKLHRAHISSTALESRGGFLRRSNQTLFITVEDGQVDRVLDILRETCRPRAERVDTTFAGGAVENLGLPATTEVPVGGATVLVLDVSTVVKI
ncbi:MAG: hypothetical protein G01um1014106_434 [Parcubacteria group bacterium Gr01-1014_106]|nr:MAG: hypothetical protein G01um1014106_434 [Parcubacteria group bacterium Gr01-1014_106]